jgi:transposase
MCGSAAVTPSTPTRSWRKKRRIRSKIRRIRRRPRRGVVLAQDETDLLLLPPLRAGWAKRGRPFEVPISGRNARRVVFGAVNLRTGSRLFLARERQRAVDFQAFLRLLHHHYRGWQVALLLDEDSSHTAAGSTDLAAEFGMELIWLPKRSPKLNPLDTLWGQAKDVISANKQYATIEEQVERFIDYLSGLSCKEALHTSGILSEDFWLRHSLSNDFCGPA